MQIARALASVAALVVLATGAMYGIGWLQRHAAETGWPIQNYVQYAQAFFATIIIASLYLTFARAKRAGASRLRAFREVGVTLATCAGVIVLSGLALTLVLDALR